eukprot:g2777.t1
MSLYGASAVFYAAASTAAVALTGSSPAGAAISPEPQPAFAPTGALEEVDGTATVQERTQRVQPQRGKRDVVDDESTEHASRSQQNTSGGAIIAVEKKEMKTGVEQQGEASGARHGLSEHAHDGAGTEDKTLRVAEGLRSAEKKDKDRTDERVGKSAKAAVELRSAKEEEKEGGDGARSDTPSVGGAGGNQDGSLEEGQNVDILGRLKAEVESEEISKSLHSAVMHKLREAGVIKEQAIDTGAVVPDARMNDEKTSEDMTTDEGKIVVVDESKGDVLVALDGKKLPLGPAPGSGEHNYVAVVVTEQMMLENKACAELFSTVSRDEERGFATRKYEQMRAWMTASQDRRTVLIKNCLDMAKNVLQLQTSKKEHVGKEKNDDAIPLRDTETVPKSGIDVMAKLLLSASSISEGGSGKPQYDPKNFVIIDLGGADAAATGKGFVHRDLSGADQNVAATPPKSSGPHEYVLVDVSLDDGLKNAAKNRFFTPLMKGQKFTMGEVNAAAADLVRAKYDKVVLASVKVTGTDEKGSGITSESVQFRSKPVAALQKGGDEKKKDKTDWGKIGGLIGGTVLVLAILGAAIAMGNGSQGAPLPESEIRATSAIDESPAPEAGGSPDGEAKATV